MADRIAAAGISFPPFLMGGGVTGELVRTVDWSQTPVGPISSWPASLKTTVGTLLHSRHPMFLWWGPELVQFYNDAYLPSFGAGKHPAAMGQRAADCWLEIWPIIWPQIDDVMHRAKATWNDDHLVPMFRNGRIEEVYWTYGYSPVFDETGGVGGTLVVCTETTRRVISDRRLRTLRTFVERTVLAATPSAARESAADIFGNEPADVPFALLYTVNGAQQTASLAKSVGITDEDCAVVDAACRDHLGTLFAQGNPQPLSRSITKSASPWPEPVTHVFVARINTRRLHPPSGYIVFGLSPRLPFDQTYRDYLLQLAEQVEQAEARIEVLHLRAVMENERNSLLETAPVATALMTGPNHVFALANPLYRELIGRTDIVGKTYLEVFPELRETPLPGILDRVYRTGEPFVTNEMLVPLDRTGEGTLEDCFFKFNLEPLRTVSGDVYGMMVIAVDITSEVAARRVLEKSDEEHKALLRELEEVSRAKDEFLAMLGHELRNPLAPILTALQLMRLRGIQGADKERAVIERQVKHVVRLVDDLLDVARITRGSIQLKIERLRLSEVIGKAIEMASPLLDQRQHRVTVHVGNDLVLDGDAGRLSQVIANVLTNAAKYTEPGGHVEVTAHRHGADVRVLIRDNGVGIDPVILPQMFDPFAQDRQDSDRSQGGLGLGLAIVRNLVEAHHGTVTLKSDGRGLGTECMIQLPLAPPESVAPPAEKEARSITSAGSDLRVLLVDDNADAADMLAESLRVLGHRVRVAYDGPQALDLPPDYVPDVVLLDLGLPVIDGYELAARLRCRPRWEQVRLVALSGYGLEKDRERTKAAGFDDHLVKPIDVIILDSTLRAMRA